MVNTVGHTYFTSRMGGNISKPPQENFGCPEVDTAEPQQFVKIVQKYLFTPRCKIPYSNMLEKKKYQISLYKSGGDHAIVVSDGVNKDITFEFSSNSTIGTTIGTTVGLVPISLVTSVLGG